MIPPKKLYGFRGTLSRGHTLIMTKGTNLVLKKTGGKLLFEIIPMSERYGIERPVCVSF